MYSDMFTLHGSKTMRKIPSFIKLLGHVKIDGLCIKKPDDLIIIARQASCTTCEIALSDIRN